MADTRESKPELKVMEWADFLASAPPDTSAAIADLCVDGELAFKAKTPDVQLYCHVCKGARFFVRYEGDLYTLTDKWSDGFLKYACRNCRKTSKTFALSAIRKTDDSATGFVKKLGEDPPFGPHIPARTIKLIGPDRELFLKGRRAEIRGLGIGAFSYYRRVVENQKSRIVEEIAKVATKLGTEPELVEELKAAAAETQFSKAIEKVKHGIPQALLIDGHNPLTLLHTALSDGMHDRSDEECLELAQDIRVVLTDLAERISQALKEEDELTQAVSRLMNRKSAKSAQTSK